MHFFQGKHRVALAIAIVVGVVVVAVAMSLAMNWGFVPYAPGPDFSPTPAFEM